MQLKKLHPYNLTLFNRHHHNNDSDIVHSNDNNKLYNICFLNICGGLKHKLHKESALMSFYGKHVTDIFGCCELKIKESDQFQHTLFPDAKTIFQPGYYKATESQQLNKYPCN